jgi:hypothetical protein
MGISLEHSLVCSEVLREGEVGKIEILLAIFCNVMQMIMHVLTFFLPLNEYVLDACITVKFASLLIAFKGEEKW